MKPCSLLPLLWVLSLFVQSQSIYPGGVAAPIQWYATSASVPGLHSLLMGNADIPAPHATLAQLNFHPSLVMDGGSLLQIGLGTRDLHDASYFTVYQSLDTGRENTVWHLVNGQHTTLVLTTSRMADLSARKYMNYTDLVRGQPCAAQTKRYAAGGGAVVEYRG